jgi:hypothetical protein
MKKLAVLATFLLLSALIVQAEETPKYTNSSFARLSFISGNTYIQRATDLGYEEGEVNTPIAEGDRIGTTDGRAEIFLGKKNYIRLDQNTKIDFLNLPKNGTSLIRVRNWAGNIYLDVEFLEREKAVEILTSDATFYILDKGLYRLDVKENKETEILVFRGVVEASGEEGSMLVKKEQRLSIADGRFLSKPTSFFAAVDDAFDRWNDNRSSLTQRQFAKRYLPEELEDYEYELDDYGYWTYISPFGNVWVPRGMAADWRPYSFGRWMWLSMAGWTWVPYEPWGWCTFHYGRWQWGMGIGWYWIPMSVWGPAWVNWWWDYDYFAWAPMSYWGYPGVIIDNFYYGRGWRDYRDYPYNSRALTVIHKNQLQAKNIQKAALSQDMLKSIGKINLTQQTLNVKPDPHTKFSVEPMEGSKQVIIKKGDQPIAESGNRSDRTTVRGRETDVSKTSKEQTSGQVKERDIKGQTQSGQKSGEETKIVERGKKGETPPPANTSGQGERKIRKKKDGEPESGSSEMEMNSYSGRNESVGYPSRAVTQENSTQKNQTSRSGSVLDRFYQRLSGDSKTSSVRSPSSSQSGSGYSSTRSTTKTSSASSSSRGSSSSSTSSSSRSGSGSSGRKKG